MQAFLGKFSSNKKPTLIVPPTGNKSFIVSQTEGSKRKYSFPRVRRINRTNKHYCFPDTLLDIPVVLWPLGFYMVLCYFFFSVFRYETDSCTLFHSKLSHNTTM